MKPDYDGVGAAATQVAGRTFRELATGVSARNFRASPEFISLGFG